jgi:DNA-binding transcriptional MerR regulator
MRARRSTLGLAMARRTQHLGARPRAPRKPLPVPPGWRIRDLAARCGVTARAIRYYVERGVLPAPEFHGSHTRYGDEHVARVFAIVAMQKERLDLDAIRRRLSVLSAADIHAYVPAPPAAAAPPSALTPPPPATYASARWDHVALLPGVELVVRADVSPAVRKVVQEIVDHCVGSGAT